MRSSKEVPHPTAAVSESQQSTKRGLTYGEEVLLLRNVFLVRRVEMKRGELLLGVVGLLLLLLLLLRGGLLWVTRIRLSSWRGSWVPSLSWGPLEGHVAHVGHVVRVRVVAHRHLVETAEAK